MAFRTFIHYLSTIMLLLVLVVQNIAQTMGNLVEVLVGKVEGVWLVKMYFMVEKAVVEKRDFVTVVFIRLLRRRRFLWKRSDLGKHVDRLGHC